MKLSKAVEISFIDTITNLGFIDVVPKEVDKDPEVNDPVVYKITVLLPFKGNIYVVIPRTLAVMFAHNISGLEVDQLNDETIMDSIYELINVFAGKIFQIYDPNLLFELSLPKQATCDEIDRDKMQLHCFQTADEEALCVLHQLKED